MKTDISQDIKSFVLFVALCVVLAAVPGLVGCGGGSEEPDACPPVTAASGTKTVPPSPCAPERV